MRMVGVISPSCQVTFTILGVFKSSAAVAFIDYYLQIYFKGLSKCFRLYSAFKISDISPSVSPYWPRLDSIILER